MDSTELLFKDITEAYGVSGFEEGIRNTIRRRLDGLVDEIVTDNIGSLIAVKKGSNPERKILFIAHMDECGFMVKSITPEGYLRFLPLGGWNPPVILGQRVTVLTKNGPVMGIVGAKPPHGMKEEERKKPVEIEDLWIDTGICIDAFNPAEELKIRPGDPIIPYGEFSPSANPKIFIARNWDNRSGCAVLLKIFEQLKDQIPACTVYGAFAVQEEVGLRGAATSAWVTEPDVGIALDVSQGHDTPTEKDNSDSKLGAGVSILIHDRTMIPHQKLRDTLIELADKNNIPYHFTFVQGGYDTGRVHLHKQGAPSCVLGIPSRYIHGFASMVHRDDIENAVQLASSFINYATPERIEELKQFE